MFKISELYVYPIKSLGGIPLQSATLSETGFEYDRHWMLIDPNGKFITQREEPKLVLFTVTLSQDALSVAYKGDILKFQIKNSSLQDSILVSIFKEKVMALKEEKRVNDWFSKHLEREVYLVRQSNTEKRLVAQNEEARILFQDGSQYLLLGNSSLQDLIPFRI